MDQGMEREVMGLAVFIIPIGVGISAETVFNGVVPPLGDPPYKLRVEEVAHFHEGGGFTLFTGDVHFSPCSFLLFLKISRCFSRVLFVLFALGLLVLFPPDRGDG